MPSSSAPDWALLHIDEVERVEIVRGSTSALYGDTAVGGVIHIITHEPDGPPRATVRSNIGTYNRAGGSFSVAGSAGPLGISLFGDADNEQGYRDRSDFRTRYLAGRARLAPVVRRSSCGARSAMPGQAICPGCCSACTPHGSMSVRASSSWTRRSG